MTFDELLHYLRLGGFTMALIVLASVVALAVGIERVLTLWGVSEASRSLGETISKHLLRGDVAAARTAAERSDSVAADIYLAGFERIDKARGGLEPAVERERASVLLRLRKHLWILGTIGATAPFVGLFGTVAGIMRSFKDLGHDVQAGGTGGTPSVITGISEALIANAAGNLVAVELRVLTEEFVEVLRERRSGSPAPSATAEGGAPVAPAVPEGT